LGADLSNFTTLDSKVGAVEAKQRTSRTRVDDRQRPMYSLNYSGNGTDVKSVTKYVLDPKTGYVKSLDRFGHARLDGAHSAQ
jgi:hypothetical protein